MFDEGIGYDGSSVLPEIPKAIVPYPVLNHNQPP